MRTYIALAITVAAVISANTAHAVGFLKIGDIKGEAVTTGTELSITSAVRATTSATTDTSTGSTGAVVETQIKGETTIEYNDSDKDGGTTEGKKGSVDATWKVEEGQKAGPALLELDGVKGEVPEKKPQKSEDVDEDADEINKGDSSMRGGVNVAVGDVNGDGITAEQKQAFLALVKAHAQVRSQQDLENFAKGILLENTQAEQISLNFEKIQMSHKGTGKLLGFFPISFVQEVEVDADGDDAGKVKVKRPWYSFLMKADVSAEEIEEEATRVVSENLGGNENWDFGARALALKTVSNVLKTKHDTAKNSVGNIR